jgi:hypothetical protein
MAALILIKRAVVSITLVQNIRQAIARVLHIGQSIEALTA